MEGTVEARNGKGIKIGGEWLNVSKFGPQLELPDVGATVRVETDAKGYLKSLDVLGGTPAVSSTSHRDERITRLAVLKAAANFVGMLSQTREDVKSEHVLRLADRWLEWVNEL
jgi:hypothetical protein